MRRGASSIHALFGLIKPKGITSHDLVSHVRRILGERRVGHAGTLDPLASGVMIIGAGQATRLMGLLTLDTKSYIADICFGTSTTTDDSEGEILQTKEIPPLCYEREFAKELLASFLGEQEQLPPSYSAISIGGVRAYQRARKGEEVHLEPRHINVFESQLIDISQSDGNLIWTCAFTVSKGSYIRSLARDIGKRAGSVAHVHALFRSSSGTITHSMCSSLEQFEAMSAKEREQLALDPASALGARVRVLTDSELIRVQNGRPLEAQGQEGTRFSLVKEDKLYGLWELHAACLRSVVTFPEGIMGVRL